MIPVKKFGLGLQDPVISANKKYLSFLHAICNIIGSVIGERAFSSAYHIIALREERSDGQTIRNDTNKAKLKGLVKALEALDRRLIIHTKNTGSYLIIRGTKVTGTVLAATKIRDFLCACYSFIPISLQKQCDGCSLSFSVCHGLRCSNRGLFVTCHNKVHDELLYLAKRSFPHSCVRGKTLIRQVCSRSEDEAC